MLWGTASEMALEIMLAMALGSRSVKGSVTASAMALEMALESKWVTVSATT
jgi:hypothetical protein